MLHQQRLACGQCASMLSLDLGIPSLTTKKVKLKNLACLLQRATRDNSSLQLDVKEKIFFYFPHTHVNLIFLKSLCECLDKNYCVQRLCFASFYFSFSFFHAFLAFYCSHTIHVIHIHFISKKKILKMGLTVLFIHLKIILLQYFQFSVSAKISYI